MENRRGHLVRETSRASAARSGRTARQKRGPLRGRRRLAAARELGRRAARAVLDEMYAGRLKLAGEEHLRCGSRVANICAPSPMSLWPLRRPIVASPPTRCRRPAGSRPRRLVATDEANLRNGCSTGTPRHAYDDAPPGRGDAAGTSNGTARRSSSAARQPPRVRARAAKVASALLCPMRRSSPRSARTATATAPAYPAPAGTPSRASVAAGPTPGRAAPSGPAGRRLSARRRPKAAAHSHTTVAQRHKSETSRRDAVSSKPVTRLSACFGAALPRRQIAAGPGGARPPPSGRECAPRRLVEVPLAQRQLLRARKAARTRAPRRVGQRVDLRRVVRGEARQQLGRRRRERNPNTAGGTLSSLTPESL